MRKALIIGLPAAALAVAGGLLLLLHTGDPVAAAKRRMARQDMRGAELYLRQAVRAQPDNTEAAFLLGQVDLSLGNPAAAELEFLRARARHFDPVALMLPLGEAYLQQGHYDSVLRDFDPDHAPPGGRADVLTIRAAAQLALRDLDGARASIGQAEALAPNGRQTLLTAGRIALAGGDLPGAQARAARVLAAEPGQEDALLLRGEIAMRRNDGAAALADAQTVLAASPARLDARLLQARALAAAGRIGEARHAADQLLRRAPKNVSGNYLSVMLAIEAGDYAAADASLNLLGPLVDQLPRGLYFLAVTKLAVGQPALAEEAATRFLAKNPDDSGGLKLLALIDLTRRHPDAALALLQAGPLAARPDADTLDLTGRAQAMLGHVQDASENFAKASALAPADARIVNHLAAAQLALGNDAAAEADLGRSLRLQPAQRLAGEALVQAALARGDTASAARTVDTLRHALGDTADVGVLAAEVQIAGLDMAGGEARLREVLKRFPDNRTAAMTLARIAAARGDHAEAELLLQARLRRQPDDADALGVLLPALFADGRIAQAVTTAEAAHAAAPQNAAITAALADAYVRAGQAARAATLLERSGATESPQLAELRARALLAAGKTGEAERVYRAAILRVPGDLRARGDLAALLMASGRADDARAVLREGLVQAPGNPALLGALVEVDLREGGIKAALARAASLRADPHNLPAADTLAGDAWLSAGDPAQAAAAFLASYRSAPSAELASRAAASLAASGHADQAIDLLVGWSAGHPDDIAAHALLGSLYIGAHRLQAAADQIEAVLAARPADAAALNNLAWVKQEIGDGAAAKSLAARAYFQSPAPEMADTLGWILARQGDTGTALPLLAQAATNADPQGRAVAEYHYGVALNTAGRHDEAKAELALATGAAADFTDKDAARRLLATLQ